MYERNNNPIMYYPFRQDANTKESIINPTSSSTIDSSNASRPFSPSLTTSQSNALNAGGVGGGIHYSGYNLPSMQNSMSSRNLNMGIPSNMTAQQAVMNMTAGRFAGGIQQIPHSGLHSHGMMQGNRSNLNNAVSSHSFNSTMNGVSTLQGGNTTSVSSLQGNPRGNMAGGMGGNLQIGSAVGRPNPTSNLGLAGPGGANTPNLQSSLNRGNIGAAAASMNITSSNLSRNVGAIAMGNFRGLDGSNPQGRPASVGMNAPNSAAGLHSNNYTASNEFLSMIGRANATVGAVGNNYSASSLLPNQSPLANGQIPGLSSLNENSNVENLTFDINEFPSLGSRANPSAPNLQVRKNATVNSILQQQQQQNTEFSIQNEDFPALPGVKGNANGDEHSKDMSHQTDSSMPSIPNHHFPSGIQYSNPSLRSGNVQNLSQLSQPNLSQPYAPQVQNQPPFPNSNQNPNQMNSTFDSPFPSKSNPVQAHQQSQLQQHLQPFPLAGSESSKDSEFLQPQTQMQTQTQGQSAMRDQDRFGLLGLLSVIRMSDPDLTTLALGTDLTTLGLSLNSRENLYKTFASPWADAPTRGEPEFSLPACYVQPAPPLQSGYFSKFQQDTLFYIFYSMPNDEAQLYAADELWKRGWFYHKEHQMWFTHIPNSEALVKTQTYERGSYYFFDPTIWETGRKDNFVLQYDMLEARPQIPTQR